MKNALLISAVALGLSSVALANGLVEPAPAPACPETPPGIYIGVQAGYADTGWKAIDVSSDDFDNELIDNEIDISRDTSFAGRLFLGWDVNKYFALEAGYFLVGQKAQIKIDDVEIADIRTQAFDLLAKIKAPLLDNAGLYAKIGPGYLMTSGRSEHDLGPLDDNVNKFDLVYGFGAYYNFTNNWTADLSYTRYNSGHTKLDEDWQPVVDFYAVGISYKFDLPV